MKNIKYIYILVALSFFFIAMSSCHRNKLSLNTPEKRTFVEMCKELGMYDNSKPVFIYNNVNYQLSVNNIRKSFRIQTDTQTQYLNVKLELMPIKVGDYVNGEVVVYKTQKEDLANYNFQCYKIEDDKLWLWDDETQTAITFPI